MAYDLDAARQAGYSDDEIASFLAPQVGFNLKGAIEAGYNASDVVADLAKARPVVRPVATASPEVAPAPEGGDAMLSANDMQQAPAAPLNVPEQAEATAPDEQTIAQRVEKASNTSVYRGVGGALDALWGMAQSGERKATQGSTPSDVAMEATPIVGPLMRSVQDAARILAPKDEEGRVKRAALAEHLDDAADAMQPELMKESFDTAASKGHVLEWMVTQAAGQSSQIATMLASIIFPPIAPATLPMMGLSAGGNQYAENVQAGVPQEKAALDAAVNGLVEIVSEAVGYKIGTGAGAAYERVLSKIPDDMRKAAASSILARVASGATTLAGAGVTEGASEASGQVVQDLSQKHIAGRDPGDMGENARTAFFASLLPGALFAAPHTAAHALAESSPGDQIGRALADEVERTQFVPGSAERLAVERLSPTNARLEQVSASTVPLDGLDLAGQLDTILKAPVTPIESGDTGPMATSGNAYEDIGLSEAPQRFDFQQSFPQPIEGSGIAPEQVAAAHGDVLEALRAARAEGEPETYAHLLDAYRGAFGEDATGQLDQMIQAEKPPVEGGEHASALESAIPEPGINTEDNAGANAGAETHAAAVGASELADLSGEAARAEQGAAPREAPQGVEDFTTRKGEVKTFATKKEAELFRQENRVPKTYSPRKSGRGEWVLSRAARSADEVKQAADRAQRQQRERARVKPDDSLATTIGKLGGINREALTTDGVDPADLKFLRSGVVGSPAVRAKGGMSLDGMAEVLAGHGFDLHDEHGAVDASKLRELIDHELGGTRVFTPEGQELRAAQAQEEAAPMHEDYSEQELADSGYDHLEPEQQDAVASVVGQVDDDLSDIPWPDEPGKASNGVVTDEELDAIFGPRKGQGRAEGAAAGEARAGPEGREGPAPAKEQGQGNVETPPTGGVSTSGDPVARAAQALRDAADALEQQAKPALDLTGETEAQIREREAREKAEREAKAKKDNAPPAGDFKLTGSDRTVDEARAHGQQELGGETSAGYDAAKAKADEVSRKFREAQQAYREKKIGDQEYLAARAEHDRAQADFDRAFEQESKGQPIADFGEKIGGARKDVWATMREAMEKAATVDVEAQPLSKSWPAPDYQALLEGGADAWSVAFMHAARDAIPSKPRQAWKVKRWAEEVKLLRDFSFGLARGTISQERAKTGLEKLAEKSRAMRGAADRIELYQMVGHAKSLEGVRVSSGQYSIHDGIHYDPPKVIWSVEKDVAATAFSNWPRMLATGATRAEALAKFKAAYDSIEFTKPRSEEVAFDIFSKRSENGFWIGKKIGRNPILLAGPFETVKEARTYKAEHQEELLAKLDKAKELPSERRASNEPRIGVDMRNAQDVTARLFGETFGFRGVEFGNWVEQGRRQQDLNDAFDALMDMAAVIGVPPRALSLNGELGLAFGARGTGGKQAAAAHYEPGKVVINLTKAQGAGSLGHEWWHALDNYFSRSRAQPDASEGLDTSLAARGSKYVAQGEVRPEMVDAFGQVVRSIMDTALRARALKLDGRRSKDYWTTTREMTARAFESYLISKLQDQGASNDYLANIVDEKTWAAAEALGFELEGSYPYPTAGEIPAIRAGFDHFFQTVLSKDTDQGTALYSRSGEQVRYANIDALSKELKPIVREAPNGLPIVANRWVALSKPRSPQNLGGGDRRVTFTIYDRTNLEAGKAAPVGALIADVDRQGLFKAIRAIEINRQFRQQGLGFGERTVAMMIAHNGGVPIEVVDIQHAGKEDTPDDALPFWRKMGVQLRNISADPNVEMDGVIDRTRYLNALDARGKVWNDGSLTRNDRDAQAAGGVESEGAQPDAGGEAGGPAGREGPGERGSDQQPPPEESGKLKRADRVDEAPGRGLSTSAAQSVAKRLGVQAKVADTVADLPEHLQRQVQDAGAEGDVRGVYDPKTGDVWLVTSNLHDEAEAVFTALHESAHRGLARLFGDDLRPLLARIYDTNDSVRGEANRMMERFGYSQARATEEVLADLAQKGEAHNLSGWERFVAFIQKWLVDRGFNIKVTDGMVEFLAGAAAQAGKEGAQVFGANEAAKFQEGKTKFSRKPTGNATLDSFDEKAGLLRTEQSFGDRIRALASTPWADVRARMNQSLFDRFHGINVAERRLGNLPAEQSGYVAARLSTGVPSVMRFLMTHAQIEWRDGVLSRKEGTKGLLDVFKPVRDDFNDWVRWMVAKRAERLTIEGREHNFTPAEIREAIAASKDNEERYRAVAREFAQFKRSVLDVAEKAGLIDGTTRPMWDQSDWIPFYRVVQGEQVAGPGGKRGLSGQNSGIRTLKGGEATLNDPLENMVMNFSHLVDASMKNHALSQVIENLGGEKGVMEKVGMQMAPALVPLSQIKKTLLEQAVPQDVVEAIPKEALAGIQKMWSVVPPSDPDVVRVMKAGKAEYWRVHDPLLLRALTAVQGQGQVWSRVLRPFKTVLTRAVTAAPDFMVRNFVRDAQQAWTIDKNGFNVGIDSVRGLVKSLKQEGGMLDMMAAGASFAGGYTFGTDPQATAQAIRRSLREKGWKATDIESFVGSMIDTPTKLLEAWEEIGSAVENANREAVYEAATRAGKSRAEAIYTAKDLMDFSMMGDAQVIAMLNDLLPFFNARLQGLYKLGRAAAEDPKRVAIRGLVLTLATLALLGANWDREKYDELEDWDKDSYWHLWMMGRHLRIPKGFEVGFLFATVPERIMRTLGGKEPFGKTVKQLVIGIRDQLAMNPIPQVARPLTELVANQDFFSGRPIEGMADEGKLPHARYSQQTSATMRAIAGAMPDASDALQLSPKAMEHLWQGYLGTVGLYVLGLADLATRKATGAPPQPALRVDDLPVVKSFVREDPARGTVFKTELYNLRTAADQAFRTVNAMVAEGNAPAAIAEAQSNQKQLAVRGVLDSGAKALNTMGSMIDAIYRDRNLSPDQKREQVDNLLRQENLVAEQTVKAVRPLVK